MEKYLFIIRHAKSDWNFQVSDFDRPLNDRGFSNAHIMAERVASAMLPPSDSQKILPEILISSPAKRALTTAQIFAQKLNYQNKNIRTDMRIYEAGTHELLNVVNELDDQHDVIALFGHNPGLSQLITYLTEGDYIDVPTAAVACLKFEHSNSWKEVSRGTATLISYQYPKDGHDLPFG